ncbi:hypothetical protein M426DRAFT_260828 [Hypoxylon sp. CI-4A]|nr:hypothetical protein M426DRAFT_260828 [Hypoxylon sp. CI-4A]
MADNNPQGPAPEPDQGNIVTCWICLGEGELKPTLINSIWNFFNKRADPFVRPCLCKGSIGYVHQQCMKGWLRHAEWQNHRVVCRRCGYRYKQVRPGAKSFKVAIVLTPIIFLSMAFILGLLPIANSIINIWLDTASESKGLESVYNVLDEGVDLWVDESSWLGHLIKGILALSLLGFFSLFSRVSPYQIWNVRKPAVVDACDLRTGRYRMRDLNLVAIPIGIYGFCEVIFSNTQWWSRNNLERKRPQVANVDLRTADNNNNNPGNNNDAGNDDNTIVLALAEIVVMMMRTTLKAVVIAVLIIIMIMIVTPLITMIMTMLTMLKT